MKNILFVLFFLIKMAEASACASQTNVTSSNTIGLFREIRDAVKWGTSTNGIQLGVALSAQNGTFIILTYLLNTNSIEFAGPAPAPHGYRLSLFMRNSDGKLIERTKFGSSLCKPVSRLMKRSMHIETVHGIYLLAPNEPRKYDDPFDLLACFNVKKPGIYTLSITGTLYGRTATLPAEVIQMNLPVTSIHVTITQANLDNYHVLIENSQ